MKRIVTDKDTGYPILPAHIDTSRHFFDSFGNMETEVSAKWIVRQCQTAGSWAPFTKAALDAACHAKGYGNFVFNRLLCDEYMQREDDEDTYYVTHEFITRCFLSSPSPEVLRT